VVAHFRVTFFVFARSLSSREYFEDMSAGKGVVKTVLSGDTLVIYGRVTSGPPPEREITLAHVSAPRIGRTADRKDEVPLFPADIFSLTRAIAFCVGESGIFAQDDHWQSRVLQDRVHEYQYQARVWNHFLE
jgi:hypothetical protein